MRAHLRRPSLLTKFSVLSLLVIVALGLGVGKMLHERIERRALLEATKLAETMTTLGLQPILLPGDLAAGHGDNHLASLDEQLKLRDFDRLGIRRLKVFNEDGVIVYSDERSIVGEAHPDAPDIRSALAGNVERSVKETRFDDGMGSHSLEVYVPLRLEGHEEPDGVVEVYLPYSPVAAAIAEDSRRLYLLLALGFVLLYATLFRIVAVASRRLRHQALHDDLTDLPNRALLYDRMEVALTAAERSGEPAALLLVDLDRFKEVNDTLGHDSGDRCWRRSPRACRASCAAATRSPGSAATSSLCSSGGSPTAGWPPSSPAACRTRSRARSCSTASRPCWTPASGSPTAPSMGPTCTRSSSAPTSRCTTPSARAPASRPTRRTAIRTLPSGCSCSASCAPRSAPESSSCTSSRRSTSPRSA